MIATHNLTMDLTNHQFLPRIKVIQDDRYTRNLAISLFSGGEKLVPGPGASAIVHYAKEDGTGGSYNFLPNEEPAWRIEGNVVTVALAPQVCTAPGRVRLCVSLHKDAAQISTFAIELDVLRNAGLQVTSEDYYRVSGTLPNFGWEPEKLLGTDAEGNVIPVEPGVKTINGTAPDEAGNVDIETGGIQTINGVGPDQDGNLSLSISAMPLPATAQAGHYLRVKSVNGNGLITAVETVDLEAEFGSAGCLPVVSLTTENALEAAISDTGCDLNSVDAAALDAVTGQGGVFAIGIRTEDESGWADVSIVMSNCAVSTDGSLACTAIGFWRNSMSTEKPLLIATLQRGIAADTGEVLWHLGMEEF